MRGSRLGVTLVLAASAVALLAFVLVPSAGGKPLRLSDCGGGKPPVITSLSISDETDTEVTISFSFSGGSATYTVNISSPATGSFSGTYSAPGGSFSQRLGGLLPHTHYRGDLTVRNDCGSDSRGIDFRTQASPPPPACAGPPVIDDLQVASITEDSAVVAYSARSGDAATVHVKVDPSGADIAGAISPPGGSGQVPLSALTANTPYTVTLVARNGCGESSRQTAFTTLRRPGCTGPPAIDDLQVLAITEKSAVVNYTARSDGAGTASVNVDPGGARVVAAIVPPSGGGWVPLPKLTPATSYTVRLVVRNDCGQIATRKTFTSLARIALAIVGAGRVTSAPAGISCAHTCAGRFSPGSAVRLTARPAPGWHFVSWRGDCGGSARTCSLEARNDAVTARFSRG